MTTHYVDITVVADAEISTPQLFGALYDRLHLTLVQQHLENIGVSFPAYHATPRTTGSTLRLHGSDEALQQLLQHDWLKGMRDHVRSGEIAAAPANAKHRTVQRKQYKTNVERLRRRRMRRKGETMEQAKEAIPITVERRPNLPYIHVHSRSTRQPFCLFIALGPLQAEATAGNFNSYGLGGPTTIPWF